MFGQVNIDPAVDQLIVGDERCEFSSLGFVQTKVEDEAGSTGYHIPEGVLAIYDPRENAAEGPTETISTTDVAPSLLAHYGLTIPDYMEGRPDALSLGT